MITDIWSQKQFTTKLAHTSMPKWWWNTILDTWMGETWYLFRISS